MPRRVVIRQHGGPEVLEVEEHAVGDPGPGEIRVRHRAVGLNFIDTYQRTGAYALDLPAGLGMEAAGDVEAVGAGVGHVREGDPVAYACQPPGAYCDVRVMPAAQVVPLPSAVSYEEAAALMLKGMTAHYLFRRTVPFAQGDAVLFHAAAGGVGLIACQWAVADGLRLIGTAGTKAKRALAVEHGAEACLDYAADWVAEAKRLTDGRGVDAVMDGVGRATWAGSLDALAPLGTMISFGAASGVPEPVPLSALAAKSLKLTRPTLFTHIADPATCRSMAREMFDLVIDGHLSVRIDQRFALDDVAEAHRALEGRATTGSTVLVP